MYGYEGSDFDSMEEGFDIFNKPLRNASNYIFNDYIIKPSHPISNNDFDPYVFCWKFIIKILDSA